MLLLASGVLMAGRAHCKWGMSSNLRRLVTTWSLPEPPPALVWTAASETAHAQDDIEYSWAGETARHVGSVVHRWLQRIAEDELQGWSAARIDTMHASFNHELAARGVTEAQLAAAVERVATALANALADPRGQCLLGPQQGARNEYRLTAMIDGERRNLVMDRTFTGTDGKRWIVDYKTSGHEGANVEEFSTGSRNATGAARALCPGASPTPSRAMLGLYFPLLAEWREWSG